MSKQYWARRDGTTWTLQPKDDPAKIRRELAGTEIELRDGTCIEESPGESWRRRFEQRHEALLLGTRKRDADEAMERLRDQATGERTTQATATMNVTRDVRRALESVIKDDARNRERIAEEVKEKGVVNLIEWFSGSSVSTAEQATKARGILAALDSAPDGQDELVLRRALGTLTRTLTEGWCGEYRPSSTNQYHNAAQYDRQVGCISIRKTVEELCALYSQRAAAKRNQIDRRTYFAAEQGWLAGQDVGGSEQPTEPTAEPETCGKASA